MDTAGQDDYQTMIDSWIGSADGFLLVYAVDDIESFESIKGKYERIIKNKQREKPPIIIVGNKCDLKDRRKVESKDAESMAKQLNVHFMEVSALEKINVKEAFLVIAKELLLKKENIDDTDNSENKKRCYCF